MNTIAPLWMWISFIGFIIVMMAVDLGAMKSRVPSIKHSLYWTLLWIALAFVFTGLLWYYCDKHLGALIAKQKAMEFFTGYLVEKTLSIDNLFVFLMIFNFFHVPNNLQRRVLTYGVLGAIIMRAIMIGIGAWLILKAHWILYVFGVFLVFTGVKMLIMAGQENKSLDDNVLLKWMRKHLPILPYFHGEKFFVMQNAKLFITPLFITLIFIELSDVIFATDSVPAIFAITQDPFIVFSSNIFAIMGLRSLYFVLARMAERFHLLKYAVAIILLIVGGKMLIEPWWSMSIIVALGLVALILVIGVVASLYKTRQQH
ncbi:MAG: TerC family protein [Gammaproteobacteria bacterium]|nr:TerC family protein [Gammaproteobacteria bacterium]